MAISGAFTAATFTGEQLLRFANNLAGIGAEQGNRKLDGTITISEVSSGGGTVLRVAVTGRSNSNANITLDA